MLAGALAGLNQANHESPIFEELYGIVLKTFGMSDVLGKALGDFGENIQAAFIFGSVARGTDHASSDIDVMVISDSLAYPELMAAVHQAETELGRVVNPKLYGTSEFREKIESDNSFVERVMKQPKIFLIGTEDDINQTL